MLTKKQLRSLKASAYQILNSRNGIDGLVKQRLADTAISAVAEVKRKEKELNLVSEPDIGALARTLITHLADRTAVSIFAPSCPDYKNNGSVYVFGGMGKGISLLASYQVGFAVKFLPVLEEHGIAYDYVVLTADIEVLDPFILAHNNVSEDEFLRRVNNTIDATEYYVERLIPPKHGSRARSSGFFREFEGFDGPVDFLRLQRRLEARITSLHRTDEKFRSHLESVNIGRFNTLYARLFGRGITPEEAMGRTIRTMAQYAALGQMARERTALITSHDTLNVSSYNDHKLSYGLSLEPDPESTFRRVPVLNFGMRIY